LADGRAPYRQKKIAGAVGLDTLRTSGEGSNPCGWALGLMVWGFIRFYQGNPWLKIFGFCF